MKMERLFILVLCSFGTFWRFTECSPIDCLISRLDFFPCQAHENSIAPGSNEYAEYITRISNRNTNPVCTYLNPQIHRNFQKIKRIDNLGYPNIRLLQSPGYALNQKYRPRRLISYNVQCPAGRKPFLIFNDLNLSPKKAECSDYCEDYITITSPDFGSSESCGTHPTDDKFSMESENFIVTFRTSESDGYLGFELGVTCFSPDLIDNGTGGIRKKRTVQFPIRFTPLEEQILKQLTAEFFELIPKCITNDVNATSRLVNTSALHLSIIYEKSSNPVIRTAAESALSIAEHQDSARVKEERQRIAGKCGRNNGDCEQICSETAISVQCSCRTGYTPAPDERSCDDINECLENNGGCQQVCNNIPGSLQCSCKPGYELDTDGINCRDIKECLVNNGGCEQICTNTPGSKQCSCRAGFKMAANGTNCTDINECLVNNGGCRQICNNIPGSRQCRCRPGFILAANGIICTDINECDVNNGGCEQMCTNTLGSRECSCRPGFKLAADGTTCTANLTVSIIVDYVRPADFFPGVNEYRAGSGPVTVTCKLEGPGSGTVSYQWSSTCRNCPFRTATSSVIRRAAVHSGDNGTHTCVVTKGGSTARASIDFLIVDAGIQIFRGSPSGNFPPDNGLVISDNPSGNDFRFRIFCRSDSMSGNVGQFIGLDGNSTLASNSIFAVARRQPGELVIENRVGIQSALTSSQQGVYTCHIPLQSEKIRIFNIGIYPSGFNTSPSIVDLTSAYSASSSNLTCTTTGSPATSVTWTINNQPLIIDGSTYHMVQTVINRPTATYENVLIINRHLSSIVGNTFTCTVANTLGSDDSNILQITVETGLNCGVQLVADSVVSITCDPDFTITAITCTLDGTSLSSCNLPLEIRTTSLSTGTHVVVLSAVGTSVDGRTITRTYTVNITNNVG